MKISACIVSLIAFCLVLPGLSAAQQLFDFNGQVRVPAQFGGTLEMVSQVYDPAPGVSPLPLDFGKFEFTLVITGLELIGDNGYTQEYVGGRIYLIQDNQTPADYNEWLGTFQDGEVLLEGYFVNFYRTLFTATLGSGRGVVNWDGGTQLDEFARVDQDNWRFLTGISRRVGQVLRGFNENWDGKVEPTIPVVPDDATTWSQLKSLYR